MNIELDRTEVQAILDGLKQLGSADPVAISATPFLRDADSRLEGALERPIYINVYHVTRHYGGPEEGGWWYNAGQLVESVETTVGDADRVRVELHEKHNHKNEGDIYSVLGGVLVEVTPEDHPGADWPAERPHYE